ncbi:SDR family NAD(P)-dependent oxidoreductase [Planococcus soli]|uniref:SDR family NAD(P)-dependent oxidoreductase n=1 Tax=Planococcus soli TaxID=2666072 RepID=UPI00115EDAD3|nr:SDR family NAD(P)-dependent oxidoreductase [Planococcus soli]
MATKKTHAGLTVVITGTSSGIGKGVAQQLAAKGANVVLAARRTKEIEALAESCGPNAIAVTTDVSREEDVAKLFETVMGVFSSIDVWINNAGIGTYGSFTDTPLKDLNRTVDINFLGTIYGSHYALNQFKKQRYGTLINVSSFASKTPMPFGAAYTGSKYGVSGLSNGLHQEMRMDGFEDIHVCSVDPWVTDTPWAQHAGNYSGHEIIVGPADDPQKVVDSIIGLIDNPQKTVEIGTKSKGIAAAGSLLPKTTKGLTGRSLLKMIQDAPPAPPTSGSLYNSGPEGTSISGNLRERLKEQK